MKRDKIPYHPFQHKLDRLKVTDSDKRRESYFLTTEEIIRARILMETKGFKLRDRLLWELFLDCGGRINAIQNVTLGQIDFQKGIIHNVKEKGGKIVDLLFFSNTSKILTDYLDTLKYKEPSDFLFQTRNRTTTFSQDGMRQSIKSIGVNNS